MRQTFLITSCIVIAAFAAASPARAASQTAPAPALAATSTVTATPKAKPETKRRKTARKRPVSKRYSPATLSAFKPLQPALTPTEPVAAESATQSQVMVNKPAETLDSLPPVVKDSADNQLLNIRPVDQPLLVPDEPALVKNDAGATDGVDPAPPVDPDSLGNEAVSVIDRDTKRPGGKSLESGMLRVKVKDKGVRAGVQIPLESPRSEDRD